MTIGSVVLDKWAILDPTSTDFNSDFVWKQESIKTTMERLGFATPEGFVRLVLELATGVNFLA